MAEEKSLWINIPRQNWAGHAADMRSTLQTWQWRWRLGTRTEVLLNFAETRFLEPWALAMFTSYGLKMRSDHGVTVQALLDSNNPCNHYIEEMGIKEALRDGKSTAKWDDSRQNTGLHVIHSHQDVTRFVQSASLLGAGPDDETMDALKYGMAELGRNVVQHAQADAGGVAIAQYFPDLDRIQVAICDSGIGILDALRTNYPELRNAKESLKLALLPHVSGAFPHGAYSASENAGLGLFFCKEISWRAGGSFWLASGASLVGISRDDASARERIYKEIFPWPGTVVVMDFPAKGVPDFGGLLGICRHLAAEARQSSGPTGLHFMKVLEPDPNVATVRVADFLEDVETAAQRRDETIKPMVQAGNEVTLDFGGARFVTQSFVHALLNDVFQIPLSVTRLSFTNCTRSTEEAIRAVAAYAASYKQIIP